MSTATREPRRKGRAVHADYLRLVRAFPLRPLRSDREYDAAAAVLDKLAVRPEGSLTPGERDYFDTLTLLVAAYDDAKFRIETTGLRGVDMLKYLMEQAEMRTTELGTLIGNRGLASLILNGRRAMSKAHIRLFADHFRVEPSLFLDTD